MAASKSSYSNSSIICGMTMKSSKRKATIALKKIIEAARKYVEAEYEIEKELRAEQTQTHFDKPKGTKK